MLAKIQAREAGLTDAEIAMAIQIGEFHNPRKADPPLDTHDYALVNIEQYWEEVYKEAEAFWAERHTGDDE